MHEQPVGTSVGRGNFALHRHRLGVHEKDLLRRRHRDPHVVVVDPLHAVGARDRRRAWVLGERHDTFSGSVVLGGCASMEVELEQLAAIGRGDPEVPASLGDATRVHRLRGQLLDDRTVRIAELIQVVVRLVDNPEAVGGRLKPVRLRPWRDPHVFDLHHFGAPLIRMKPILPAMPRNWNLPLGRRARRVSASLTRWQFRCYSRPTLAYCRLSPPVVSETECRASYGRYHWAALLEGGTDA